MNKGLILKIAIGLIVISVPASMLLNSKTEKENSIEISQGVQEDSEVLDNLYGDTFEGSDDSENVDESLYSDDEVEDIEEITSDSTSEEVNDDKNDEVSQNSKTVTGIYQGFADGNFIEVKIGDEYGVFKVPNDMKSKVEAKDLGDSLTFTYVSSAGQQVITSVN